MSLSSEQQRRIMVDRQVRTFDVTDQIVTGRMLAVPRERFVDAAMAPLAYSDLPIDLAGDAGPRSRVLLPPFVTARMLQAATPLPTDRVLDIAGGSGYSAALLAGLCASVVAVESDKTLAGKAKENAAALGLANLRVVAAPLDKGGAEFGPYDLIFINGFAEEGLAGLAALLAPNGRMIAIIAKASGATMAARIGGGRGDDLSILPLFDAQAPILDAFRRAPAFVL